jgi:CIC family chloride channel protein
MIDDASAAGATLQDIAAGAAVIERGEKLNRARRRLFPHALVIGILTGGLAVAFRVCLEQGEQLRSQFIDWASTLGAPGFAMLAAVAIALFAVALLAITRIVPEASGSGIPHLRLVLREDGNLRWRRILPIKFISGLFGITGGLCLGREGPTIQMGAAIGAMWGGSYLGRAADRRSLLVTGASAGLAAAFNAPMAGILFVIEELHINIPDSAYFTAMIACIAADLLARILLGQTPVLRAALAQIPPLTSLPFFIVLGLLSAGLAWAFNKAIVVSTRRLRTPSIRKNLAKAAVAGLVAAIVGWFYPALLGGGLALTNRALAGQGAVGWLAAMFLLRFVFSIGSYAIGTAGGIFAPLLVLGGLLGLLVGELSQLVIPTAVPEPTAFAVVGMAAAFAGIVRCPLTGIVLIIEMTGHYELILPLMVASFTAAIAADELNVGPVYDALLAVQLAAGAPAAPAAAAQRKPAPQ